tara:strand:+ start:2233 stop:2802 length:570 start_codon:yes stop_codon:yes gene_type:complete
MRNHKYSTYKKIDQIDEIVIFSYKTFKDTRGNFYEIYKKSEINFLNYKFNIKQINSSLSKKNVIRGLHLQVNPKMSKIMRLIKGKAIFFAFDVSKKNKKNKIHTKLVNENDPIHIWAPYYYARGFLSLSNNTMIEYLCDAEYNPFNEHTINIFDNDINHGLKNKKYILSNKDLNAQSIKQFREKNIIRI